MKLSIKEKAQRYDEAIERANEMIKAMTDIGGVAKLKTYVAGNQQIKGKNESCYIKLVS